MIVKKILKQLIVMLLVGFFIDSTTNLANAQYFTSPSINAVGGAGAASRAEAGNLLINPASLALMQAIEFEGHYRNGDLSGGRTESFYGLTVADNTENVLIAGGLSYLRGKRTFGDLEAEDQYWNISAAKRFSSRLLVGGSALILDSRVEGGQSHTQYSGTLGAMVLVNKAWVLGFVYDSFITPDPDVPIPYQLTPTSRIGMRWTPQDFFSVRLDLSRKEHKNPEEEGAVHLGMESFVNEYNILRLGAKIDDFYKQNFLTLGWGFNGPRLKINYSFEKPLKNSNGAMHSVDLLIGF